MRPVVFRLVLCAGLFSLWMGYLAYLVLTRPLTRPWVGTPLVVSRAQVQRSDVDVVARIDSKPGPETEVTVVKVLYQSKGGPKEGDRITVVGLDDCRPVPRENAPPPADDWTGAGDYLVPLRYGIGGEADLRRFHVAAVPPSPGFTRHVVRIYPATPEALAQYHRIVPLQDGQPHKPERQ